ncbi:zinc-ribbon domain-containing protein [Anatilimnocola floriformis]|uniref:zinc-ribbon domain-containing protein n=1 Tax=Anatilimnocola floriformis TaxID=2948575 RepID=UPI0020C34532|nr:zinc-ribbon domain-containing protein [Anatilimnocola floriformis]
MPIEFLCPTCQQQLRVPDTAAGKNAKCPKCATILTVPGSSPSDSPLSPPPQAGFDFSPPKPAPPSQPPLAPAPAANSFASTAPSNPFADPPKEANAFGFNDARYAPAGHSTNQATIPAVAPNPYASPQGGYQVQRLATPGQLGYQIVEVTPIVNHAIEIWKNHLVIGVVKSLLPALIFIPLVFLLLLAIGVAAKANEALAYVIMIPASLIFVVAEVWLSIGQVQMSLKLARGQEAHLSEIFGGGERLLPMLAYTLLLAPVMMVSVFMAHVPLILFLLFCWPSYYLVIEGKCGVLESFRLAKQITEGNKLTSFVLALVVYGFSMLGYMACLVGIIFVIPLISIMFATAYLMMTGQLPIPPKPQPQYYPPQPNPHQGYAQPPQYLPPPQR